MMHVYLIENKKGIIYIGSTENPKQRIQNHNDGTQKGWTRSRGPWEIIHTEKYKTRSEAIKREKYLKSLKAGKRIKRILNISEG